MSNNQDSGSAKANEVQQKLMRLLNGSKSSPFGSKGVRSSSSENKLADNSRAEQGIKPANSTQDEVLHPIELCPQVEALGLWAQDSSKHYWMSSRCKILISSGVLTSKSRISFKLRCGDADLYKHFPPTICLAVNGAVAGKIKFNVPNETATVALEIDAKSKTTSITLESSESFIPARLGINSDSRELSVQFFDFVLAPVTAEKKLVSLIDVPTSDSLPEQQTTIDSSKQQQLTIGIDARTLSYPESFARGIGQYTYYHLLALFKQAPNNSFYLCLEDDSLNQQLKQLLSFPNVKTARYGRSDFPHNFDIFHIPDPLTTLAGFDSPFILAPHNAAQTALVHDLIPLVLHELYALTYNSSQQLAYNRRLSQLKQADASLLTTSNCTKQDLINHLGISPSKITPIMAGLSQARTRKPLQSEIEEVLAKYSLRKPYFLFVGSHDPYKNFLVALQAFCLAKKSKKIQLAVVGDLDDPHKKRNRQFIEREGIDSIIWTGFVPREDLECLYAGSCALLFPSVYEGFGLPVLEAMANSCPVITTKFGSIPEITGDAAIVVNPSDIESIANTMQYLAEDRSSASELISNGISRAQAFSWEDTAIRTLDVWNKLAKEKKSSEKSQTPVPSHKNSIQKTKPSSVTEPRICWIAPVLNYSGYAMVARNLIKGVVYRDYPIDVIPLCGGSTQGALDGNTLRTIVPQMRDLPVRNSVIIWQSVPSNHQGQSYVAKYFAESPNPKAKVIATIFETDRIPASWVAPCNEADEVWVHTKFNMETFASSGVNSSKIHYVPFHGIDPRLFPITARPMKYQGDKSFNFLSIFEWTKRKGWDVLLRAYFEEFNKNDDVALNLFVSRSHGTNHKRTACEIAQEFISHNYGGKESSLPAISIIEGHGLADHDMASLYAGADAFVLPTRGEGWGMPYLEAMAMGLPTIGTNWGGNLEFMNRDNSYLIETNGLVAVDQEQIIDNPFYLNHQWADPSVGSLRELMRYVVSNREEAKKVGKQARVDVYNNWTLTHAADRVIERVRQIGKGKSSNSLEGKITREKTDNTIKEQITVPTVACSDTATNKMLDM